MARVGGNEGLVRVATTTDTNLTVNDNFGWTCSVERSPCYYLPEGPALPDQVPVCLALDNDAPGDSKPVLQCLQCNVTPFQGKQALQVSLLYFMLDGRHVKRRPSCNGVRTQLKRHRLPPVAGQHQQGVVP